MNRSIFAHIPTQRAIDWRLLERRRGDVRSFSLVNEASVRIRDVNCSVRSLDGQRANETTAKKAGTALTDGRSNTDNCETGGSW
jgi:hypothetical protein